MEIIFAVTLLLLLHLSAAKDVVFVTDEFVSYRRGRATANYVIQNYEHLFQHKWSVDSIDTWINLEDEEIPALHLADESRASIESGDTELSSDMDTVEKFRTLVEQKKVFNFCSSTIIILIKFELKTV